MNGELARLPAGDLETFSQIGPPQRRELRPVVGHGAFDVDVAAAAAGGHGAAGVEAQRIGGHVQRVESQLFVGMPVVAARR